MSRAAIDAAGILVEQTTMNDRARQAMSKQSGSRFLLVCMLLLGFAVVFWGLHDKVSLYHHTGAAPPVAKAKLLSGREHTADLTAAPAPAPPAPAAPITILLCATLMRMLFRFRSGRSHTPPPTQALPFAQALHRRPPPRMALAHS